VLSYQYVILCRYIQDVSFIVSPSTETLSHRQPLSAEIFRDNCRAQGLDKEHTVLRDAIPVINGVPYVLFVNMEVRKCVALQVPRIKLRLISP
jgi:hypothetical protein